MTNQQQAEDLLRVLCHSPFHNPAWAIREVLERLRQQLAGTNSTDSTDELSVMYNSGWDDCLKEIDAICDELELL